jgi:two-component system, chemotaxis family, chemotaxis protein CheY
MKTLIVEDELTSRVILEKILSPFGEVHLCYNGTEAITTFCSMLDQGTPFDLICMDFMMPEIDGHAALTRIRAIEKERGISRSEGVKVIMTTGLSNIETEYIDIKSMCEMILLKPIRKVALLKSLQDLGYSRPD